MIRAAGLLGLGLALALTAAPVAAEMTHAEMVLANHCKTLAPKAMMRDRRCVALMKRYPEAMAKSADVMSTQPPH